MNKHLLDKTTLINLEFKNRFIRSATHEGLADKQGYVTQELIDTYEKIANGGVSTIVTGFAFVVEGAQSSPGMLAAYDDKFIEGLQKLSSTAHKYGTNIVLQVAEGGSQAKINTKKRIIYGPSAIDHKYTGITSIEMSPQVIDQHVKAFGDAALRAKNSGFDAIQIHGAHGYLLSQFLTPYYNRRTDKYGGSIENRARIVFEVYENMREKAGDDFPIFIKINCQDFMGDEGLTFEESRFVCKKLDKMGIDLIEISGNVGFNEVEPRIIQQGIFKNPEKQCYFSEYAKVIAEETGCPTAVVGGNRNFNKLHDILNSSNIEYFSISRPLLCEPNLVNNWIKDPNHEPKCLSCNKCFSLKGNVCIYNREFSHKKLHC